ncbi:MAG: hypothetical protein ABWZ52_06990 [Acidimicrobiales bacterium]
MNPLTTFVRSLGNDRALSNVQTVLDARRTEDWLVRGLARRLEHIGLDSPVADPAVAVATAATTTAA